MDSNVDIENGTSEDCTRKNSEELKKLRVRVTSTIVATNLEVSDVLDWVLYAHSKEVSGKPNEQLCDLQYLNKHINSRDVAKLKDSFKNLKLCDGKDR